MSRTTKFREQHNDLLKLAGELSNLLNAAELSNDASKARRCLSQLMGKLGLHLSIEDKVLYPELESHKNPALAAIAKRFSSEMKSVTNAVVAYNEKWSTPSAIKADAANFIKETKQIISILGDRIKRENQELYAAADKVEGAAII